MKRSEFFKSLVGIAIGAVIAPAAVLDSIDISEVKEVLPAFDKEVTIQTGCIAFDQEDFIMKPNSNPPMTQEEYENHMKIKFG